jgi:hypothetical protein
MGLIVCNWINVTLLSCLFFFCGLVLPVLSWFCLLSFSVCRIPWIIFCSDGFVVIYCFNFCLSWKTFIAPSILNDSFAGLKLFSFSAQKTSLHSLLAFNVSVEKSAVILMDLPLYIIFFFSYSLQYSFSILCACCFNDNMSWGSSILVKSVWCPGGFLYLNGCSFL